MSRSILSLLSTEHKNYSVASSTCTIFCVAMLYTISPRNICKRLISRCYPRSLRRGTNENGKKVMVSLSPRSRLGATAVSRWHSVRDVCYEQLHASQWWEQGALETKRSINAALWIKKTSVSRSLPPPLLCRGLPMLEPSTRPVCNGRLMDGGPGERLWRLGGSRD